MFHEDSNLDQVEENQNDISESKRHSNPQIKESAEKKAPKFSQGRMSYDDSELENEENQINIHVISGNDHMHPFGPQIQESKL